MALDSAQESQETNTRVPPAPQKISGKPKKSGFKIRIGLVLGLLIGAVIWELAGRFYFEPIFFKPFSEVLVALFNLASNPVFWKALGESLQLFVAGFLIGSLLGLVLGIVIGRIALIGGALESYVTILYVTPPIAMIPFVLSILGFGYWPKAIIVSWFVFFPVCITTIEGVRAVSPRLLEVARSFGSTEARTWRDVVIPSTLPFAMSGIRQGVALGFVGVVAAEFLLDASGIGLLLRTYSRLYQTDNLFAAVIVMTVLGLTVMTLGKWIERRFATWRQ